MSSSPGSLHLFSQTGITVHVYGTTPGMNAVGYLRANDSLNDAPAGGNSGILATFSTVSLPSTAQDISFAPFTSFVLAANTQYWFTFAASPAARPGSRSRAATRFSSPCRASPLWRAQPPRNLRLWPWRVFAGGIALRTRRKRPA